MKRRRAGATEVFSVSVDAKTKAMLKRLAKARYGGNVSALITELVEQQARLEAGRRFLASAGFRGLTDARRAEIDAEIAALAAPRRKRPAA
jgi:hypothetical protein